MIQYTANHNRIDKEYHQEMFLIQHTGKGAAKQQADNQIVIIQVHLTTKTHHSRLTIELSWNIRTYT